MKESFIRVENGEVYIYGMHISPYEKGNIFNKDPMRVLNYFFTDMRSTKSKEVFRKKA